MRPIFEPEGMAALTTVPLIAAKGDNLRLDTDIGSILGYILLGMIVGLLARGDVAAGCVIVGAKGH